MNLQRCHLQGFGKLAGLPLVFSPGLNLVFAPNEGGKSTLLHFLVGMLYGQLRTDAKVRRLDPWVERYRPWTGTDFGGILWCELACGRQLEIRRDFGKDDYRIEIRTVAGEEITSEYERLKTGEVLFAARHLNLTKELFESVAVVRETGTAELGGRETVRDRIANLAHSGYEDISVQESILRLRQALDSVGSERAPTKPYRRALDRLDSLQLERGALEARRQEYQAWLEQRTRLSADVGRLERELSSAKAATAAARLRETEHKCRTLEQIQHDIESVRTEMGMLSADPGFPAQRLDELNTLHGSREATRQQLLEIRKDIGPVIERARQLGEELKPLAAYADLYAAGEGEKVSEWFHKYLALSIQRDESQRALMALQAEIRSLEGIINGRPFLRDSTVDWEQRAREIAEAERADSERIVSLAGEVLRERSELQAATGRIRRMFILGAAFFAAAAVSLWSRFMPGPQLLSPGMSLFLVVLFGSAAAAAVLAGLRLISTARDIRRRIADLDLAQERLRESSRETSAPLRRAVAEAGSATVDEFLASAREVRQTLFRLQDLQERLENLQGKCAQLVRDADEPFTGLRDCLDKVGLACAPGNLSTVVDIARSNLRRLRDLELRRKGNVDRLESLRADEQELQGQLAAKDSEVEAILSGAGVPSLEAFREACESRRRLLQMRDREKSLMREFERVGEGKPLEYWKERRGRLEAAPELAALTGPETADPSSAIDKVRVPTLPYPPGVEEAERAERGVASLQAAAREELARIAERLNRAFSGLRTMSEIDEDIAVAGTELNSLKQNRRALEIAIEVIEAQLRQQQEVLAPQLNRAVEGRFVALSSGRYSEVKIDPDFNILAREAGTNELRPIGQLSRGTQDQIYFALRFGILELISSAEEPCPCLLDEPFAAYDRGRIDAAFKILAGEASRRQLMLFTCREDVRDLALACGASLLEFSR